MTGMGSNSIYMLMDLPIAGCGVYVVYNYIAMYVSKSIKSSVLFPKDLNISKCKDVQGFIKYIGISQVAFGLAAILSGGLGLYQDYTGTASAGAYLLTVAIFLIFAAWYSIAMKKALKIYW